MIMMTPDRTTWVRHFRELLPEMLEDLARLVNCESPSSDHAALQISADLVAEIGTRLLGAEPERITLDGCPHLRWRIALRTAGNSNEEESTPPRRPSVLLVGHHDTVWPIGSVQAHPFVIEEGPSGRILRGPGCFDMLTGVVQTFQAVAALQSLPHGQEHDPRADGTATILMTGDEELGSPGSQGLIKEEARKASAAFVLEASADGGAVKIGRKGVSLYSVEIIGRAAHAGLEPEKGVNAGIELATQVLRIADLGDVDLGTTVTPTVLSAGTTTNTVPARALLAVDSRARTRAEQERVDAAMQGLRPHLAGAEIRVSGGINRPPLEESASAELFARAGVEAAALGLAPLRSASVGGGSDGNFTAGVGTPTLDGLGAVGGGAHGADEHVQLDEIPARTALLTALIDSVLREPPNALPAGDSAALEPERQP